MPETPHPGPERVRQLHPDSRAGAAYEKFANAACSVSIIPRCRDERITAEILERPERLALGSYDRVAGIDFDDLDIDAGTVNAFEGARLPISPGGTAAGKAPKTPCSLMSKACRWGPVHPAESARLHGAGPELERMHRFDLHLPKMSTSIWTRATTRPSLMTCRKKSGVMVRWKPKAFPRRSK